MLLTVLSSAPNERSFGDACVRVARFFDGIGDQLGEYMREQWRGTHANRDWATVRQPFAAGGLTTTSNIESMNASIKKALGTKCGLKSAQSISDVVHGLLAYMTFHSAQPRNQVSNALRLIQHSFGQDTANSQRRDTVEHGVEEADPMCFPRMHVAEIQRARDNCALLGDGDVDTGLEVMENLLRTLNQVHALSYTLGHIVGVRAKLDGVDLDTQMRQAAQLWASHQPEAPADESGVPMSTNVDMGCFCGIDTDAMWLGANVAYTDEEATSLLRVGNDSSDIRLEDAPLDIFLVPTRALLATMSWTVAQRDHSLALVLEHARRYWDYVCEPTSVEFPGAAAMSRSELYSLAADSKNSADRVGPGGQRRRGNKGSSRVVGLQRALAAQAQAQAEAKASAQRRSGRGARRRRGAPLSIDESDGEDEPERVRQRLGDDGDGFEDSAAVSGDESVYYGSEAEAERVHEVQQGSLLGLLASFAIVVRLRHDPATPSAYHYFCTCRHFRAHRICEHEIAAVGASSTNGVYAVPESSVNV